MEEKTFEQALEQAIRLLTPREHSELELTNKLKSRDYSIQMINQVLVKLKQLDYISNERYTEIYVSQRARKGDGPSKIRANLMKRGITSELIGRFLNKDESFWQHVAAEVIQKKLKLGDNVPIQLDSSRLRKLYTFLASRGFSSRITRQAIDDLNRQVNKPESVD